jgi:hypothetical protein
MKRTLGIWQPILLFSVTLGGAIACKSKPADPEPPRLDSSAFTPTTEPIFSFETNTDGWYTASGDNALLKAESVAQHATDGYHALRLEFAGLTPTRALIATVDTDRNLSNQGALNLDVFNPTAQLLVLTVALLTGPERIWHESLPHTLEPESPDQISVDLTASHWKTAASDWQNNVSIAARDQVTGLALKVISQDELSGQLYVDYIRTQR